MKQAATGMYGTMPIAKPSLFALQAHSSHNPQGIWKTYLVLVFASIGIFATVTVAVLPKDRRSGSSRGGFGVRAAAFVYEVHCYDLNHNTSRANIIYQTDGVLMSFDCVSAIDSDGRPFACVVLNEQMRTRQISIYSFNVREQSEVTLDLLHQFEYGWQSNIDSVRLGPRVIVIQGEVGHDVIAMDVHARTQFLLPSFTHAQLEITEDDTPISIMPTSISTSTHLLLAWSYRSRATGGWRTWFQAFALPPSDPHRHFSTPLSPSHSGVISGIKVSGTVLLHDSIFDPTTRDVLVAVRVHAFKPSSSLDALLKHGILRLSAAPTSHDHKVGTITFQLLGSLGQFSGTPFLHPSFNGVGRTFYTLQQGSHGILSALEYDLHTSSNDDGEQEAKVVEFPSVLQFLTPRNLLDYDPYSGLICLRPAEKKDVVEIYDLSV